MSWNSVRFLAPAMALLVAIMPMTLVHADTAPLEVVDVRTDAFPRIVARLKDPSAASLNLDELRVVEDGRVQPSADAVQLRSPAVPMSVSLAVDVSDASELPTAKSAAKFFTEQMRPIDKLSLITFAGEVIVPQSLTADRQQLARSIDTLQAGQQTSLYDAVAQGLTQLSLAPGGTRALVVLTDGKDTMSERQVPDDVSQAVGLAVPIYTIGLGPNADTEVLQSLSSATGGRYYAAATSADLTDVFHTISQQLGAEYQVTWVSDSQVVAGSNVPVQISLGHSDGTQSSVDLTYVPPFSSGRSQNTNPIQALSEVSPTEVPSEALAIGLSVLAGLSTLLVLVGFSLRRINRRLHSRLTAYVAGRPTSMSAETTASLRRKQLSPLTLMAASVVARLLPRKQIKWLRSKLVQAGYQSDRHFNIFLASELVLAVVFGSACYLFLQLSSLPIRSSSLMFAFLAAILGGYVPYMWLRRRVDARQRNLLRALPDALDLMCISMTAGLSLDTAMSEVVQKWDGDLSRELNQVLNEMRMGTSRRDALKALADRTQLQDIQLLVAALLQADELGSNISEVLSVQAEQLRVRRHHIVEEKARKAPVKMLLPLCLLIFPALFVVVMAPAFIQLGSVLGGLAHHA